MFDAVAIGTGSGHEGLKKLALQQLERRSCQPIKSSSANGTTYLTDDRRQQGGIGYLHGTLNDTYTDRSLYLPGQASQVATLVNSLIDNQVQAVEQAGSDGDSSRVLVLGE